MPDLSTWPDADRCAFMVPGRRGQPPYRCGGARWPHAEGSHPFEERPGLRRELDEAGAAKGPALTPVQGGRLVGLGAAKKAATG